jgi:hypothetical protein
VDNVAWPMLREAAMLFEGKVGQSESDVKIYSAKRYKFGTSCVEALVVPKKP